MVLFFTVRTPFRLCPSRHLVCTGHHRRHILNPHGQHDVMYPVILLPNCKLVTIEELKEIEDRRY